MEPLNLIVPELWVKVPPDWVKVPATDIMLVGAVKAPEERVKVSETLNEE